MSYGSGLDLYRKLVSTGDEGPEFPTTSVCLGKIL